VQDLKLSGKRPVASDKFTMLVIVGISIVHCLRIDVGSGSRSQVELFEAEINFDISSVVAGVNWHRTGGVVDGTENRSGLQESSSLWRSKLILSEKKEENLLHSSVVFSDDGRTGSEWRRSRLLIVRQSFLESDLDEEINDL
jgi:hypothetical protein